jgi:hypothetical protein
MFVAAISVAEISAGNFDEMTKAGAVLSIRE